MSREALGTYLHDHYAGSVGAVALVERTIRENEGAPLAARLSRVLDEIRKDQAVLHDLVERLGAGRGSIKNAGAWLAEKAGRVKLGGTDEPDQLSRMESLEMLTVGILGKRALWRALRTVASKHDVLQGLDFDLLERRAAEQHDEVEAMRLEAARVVL